MPSLASLQSEQLKAGCDELGIENDACGGGSGGGSGGSGDG